jgi:molecular chaperone DnaK (HSP70)/DNA-binding beta-propeller fold protein YncE
VNALFPIVGIDFGTSNSKIAWYNPRTHQAEIIRNSEKKEQIPSVVYFSEKETLVGDAAIDMLVDEHERENVIISVKRELVNTPVVAIPARSVKTVDIAATILHKLKEDAEALHFQQEVTHAVITCPASFARMDQDKLREAACLAGFREVELLEEPVAAALAYAQMGLKVGNYVLVYDLGGGTFDLALLAREDDGSFRLAMEPQGLKHCGGDDFDEALYNYCDAIAKEKRGRPISLTGKRDLNFLNECRRWKENLASRERRAMRCLLEPGPLEPSPVLFEYQIERATFEGLIHNIVEETVRRTKAMLEQARVDGYTVDTLVLVGGSTSVSLVQRLLAESLPLKPLAWQYQDVAVALGAAYYAHNLWGPETQYRKAVRTAWAEQRLDESKIAGLTTLAKTLSLDENQVADLECEIMGDTKEVIFTRQVAQDHYRAAVQAVWVNKKLDETNIQELIALAKNLSLNSDQVVDLDREVMGEVKETILARQRAQEQYRKAVEEAWAAKTLNERKVEHLTALVQGLDLSRETTVTIEREVMGEVKETILARQRAQEQYRETVKVIWADKTLDEAKVEQLVNLAHTLNLSEDQVTEIECEEMGETKETIFARQRALAQYREAVNDVWADKQLDRRKLAQLYAVANKLKLSDDQIDDVECEVMSDIKERIFVTQYTRGLGAPGGTRKPDVKEALPEGQTNYFALTKTFRDRPVAIRSVAFSPDGQTLGTADTDSGTQLWDVSTEKLLHPLRWPELSIHYIAFTPEGVALAISTDYSSIFTDYSSIRIWNACTADLYYTFNYGGRIRGGVTLSSDGQGVAFGCDDKTVKLWDLRTGKFLRFKGHSGYINTVAVSSDGQTLASGSDDNTVKLWHLPTGKLLRTLTGHKGSVRAVAFSSDGQIVASGGADGTIRLWNPNIENVLRILSGHGGAIRCLAFRSDGRFLASGSSDRTVRLWDPQTGRLLQTLTGYSGGVNALTFSPDGQTLASGSDDTTVKLWTMSSNTPAATP